MLAQVAWVLVFCSQDVEFDTLWEHLIFDNPVSSILYSFLFY